MHSTGTDTTRFVAGKSTAYGDDTEGWDGQPLVLFPALVDLRGDSVEAIRVRASKQKETPKQPLREAVETPDAGANAWRRIVVARHWSRRLVERDS